jgi:hypothetical protein
MTCNFFFRIEEESKQFVQKEAGEVHTEETQRGEKARRREQQCRVPVQHSHGYSRCQLYQLLFFP